ncbi:MAG: HD domain-containing protein [Bacteroidota bacterium]|nr:HD domain-containing protein [Bacteroidota bacterium]
MLASIDNFEEKYNALFEKLLDRKEQGVKFKSFLENETCWLTSPASTRFHLNIEKGLLIHSVGVAYNALGIKNLLAPDISDESIVITGLFHDLGKIGLPGKPYYLPNDNKWEIEKRGINYKINPEIVTMNIAVRSLYLVSKHIPLTEMEAQAIVAHDGIYPVMGGVNNLDYHHNECRLQMIVHFADKWTAAVEEDGRR